MYENKMKKHLQFMKLNKKIAVLLWEGTGKIKN